MSDDDCCASCCCCGCCKGDADRPLPDHLQDPEKFFSERNCTDVLMIILYALFVCGWCAIIGVAVEKGKPERILYPNNERGELCGDDGALYAYPNAWYPLPTDPTYAFCVKACPGVGDIKCNNAEETQLGTSNTKVRNSYYDHTLEEFVAGAAANAACRASISCGSGSSNEALSNKYAGLQIKMKEKKCFFAYYPSKASMLRCLPNLNNSAVGGGVNSTMQALANQTLGGLTGLSNALGMSSFFTLGYGEVKQTWRVILFSSIICMLIAALWIGLLRCILAPLVYICIVLVFGILIALGFIFKGLADDLEANIVAGQSTDGQVDFYRALEYLMWILAGLYVIIMIFLWKRVKIAIAIMTEATYAFAAAPSMIIVPLVTFFVFVGWVVFFLFTTLYIQTMGDEATKEFTTSATSYFGSSAESISSLMSGSTLNSSGNVTVGSIDPKYNISTWYVDDQTKALHAYNLFAVLWTANFCIGFGFYIMAMCVCAWYFSYQSNNPSQTMKHDDDDDSPSEKSVDPGVICSAFKATICNHLGTVLWGAFLIAVIQMIRAIFLYIQETYLKDWKESCGGQCALCLINCCLSYCEHVVKVISQNAYVVSIIRNQGFCSSAAETLSLLVENAARITVLASITNVTLFLVKCFIVGCNTLIAYALLKETRLTEDRMVESGLFPMLLIILLSFAIAALFLNVYESCIDAIFICFLMDEKHYKSKFMPKELAVVIGAFRDEDEARLQAEKSAAAQIDNIDKAEPKSS